MFKWSFLKVFIFRYALCFASRTNTIKIINYKGLTMKMSAYKDYMKLLFDKYLIKVLYLYFVSLAILAIVAIVIEFDKITVYIEHGTPFVQGMDNFIMGTTTALFGVPAIYYISRFLIINLPSYICRSIKYVKKDIDNIQKKHEVNN